jgi:hypothetical protein
VRRQADEDSDTYDDTSRLRLGVLKAHDHSRPDHAVGERHSKLAGLSSGPRVSRIRKMSYKQYKSQQINPS